MGKIETLNNTGDLAELLVSIVVPLFRTYDLWDWQCRVYLSS